MSFGQSWFRPLHPQSPVKAFLAPPGAEVASGAGTKEEPKCLAGEQEPGVRVQGRDRDAQGHGAASAPTM